MKENLFTRHTHASKYYEENVDTKMRFFSYYSDDKHDYEEKFLYTYYFDGMLINKYNYLSRIITNRI